MSNQSKQHFRARSLGTPEGTFAEIVFLVTALFYVGVTIAMFLQNSPIAA